MKLQNISTHSDNFHFNFIYLLSDWVEILWSRNSFSNRCSNFQVSILKNKTVLFLKKYDLGRSLEIGQESSNRWRLLSQFSVKFLVLAATLFGKVLGNFDRWKKNYSRSLRPMLHTPKILMTLELQSVYKKPETKFIKKGGIFILSFSGLFIWASIKFYNKSKIFSILFLSFPCPKNIVQKWFWIWNIQINILFW